MWFIWCPAGSRLRHGLVQSSADPFTTIYLPAKPRARNEFRITHQAACRLINYAAMSVTKRSRFVVICWLWSSGSGAPGADIQKAGGRAMQQWRNVRRCRGWRGCCSCLLMTTGQSCRRGGWWEWQKQLNAEWIEKMYQHHLYIENIGGFSYSFILAIQNVSFRASLWYCTTSRLHD